MLLSLLLAGACNVLSPAEGPSGTADDPHETDDVRDTDEDTDDTEDTHDSDSAADTAHDTAAADPGAALYTANCASCHGEDGKLGAGGAADLTYEVPRSSDAKLTGVVLNGKNAMPAFTFTDTELADLLAHLRATFGGPP